MGRDHRSHSNEPVNIWWSYLIYCQRHTHMRPTGCLPVKILEDRLRANQGAHEKSLQLFLPAGLQWTRPESPQALGITAVLEHTWLGLQRLLIDKYIYLPESFQVQVKCKSFTSVGEVRDTCRMYIWDGMLWQSTWLHFEGLECIPLKALNARLPERMLSFRILVLQLQVMLSVVYFY